MLKRMTNDVAAFAAAANSSPTAKLNGLEDLDLKDFFANKPWSEKRLRTAQDTLKKILEELKALREADTCCINDVVRMVKHIANFVDVGSHPIGSPERRARTKFMLRQAAKQAPIIWVEFLFGSILASKDRQDLAKLNPYFTECHGIVLRLVCVAMLRANRVGHANRCLGTAVNLLGLLEKALKTKPGTDRAVAGTTLSKLAQASEALAVGLD